jgi:hypothetical protein
MKTWKVIVTDDVQDGFQDRKNGYAKELLRFHG